MGGVPLIYLGDEVGMLNDYGYRQDPAKAGTAVGCTGHTPTGTRSPCATSRARWRHRCTAACSGSSPCARPRSAFAGADMSIVDTGNSHVFGYVRQHAGARIVILANFSEREQRIDANTVRNHGLSYSFRDLVTGDTIVTRRRSAAGTLPIRLDGGNLVHLG